LSTNTSCGEQYVTLVITATDGTVIYDDVIARTGTGNEATLIFDQPIELDIALDYNIHWNVPYKLDTI
jgi:hypothetical protein